MENNTLPAEVQEQIRLQAERVYNDLDQAAREYDPHEYGLPMVENHTWHIEAALTEWAIKANIQEAAIELLVEKYQSLKTQRLILWAKESAVEKTDKLLCCRWISNNGYIYGSVQWDAQGRRWLNDVVNEKKEIEILNPFLKEAQQGVWVEDKPKKDGFYAVKYVGGGYGGCGFINGKWNQSITDSKIIAYLDESATSNYSALKERAEKLALALRRLSRSVSVHPEFSNDSEWGDYVSGAEEALSEWEGEKEVQL